jgi:glucose-6-phosphate 1-epimerase
MLRDLNARFALPGLRFESGKGGLVRIVVQSPLATGELYLQGAHVTEWTPTGHQPVLWMSAASQFEIGKPIRGGVPLCFPWFGPNAAQPSAPAHGFARLREWQIASTCTKDDGAIEVHLQSTIEPFRLAYQVEFGAALKTTLATQLLPNETSSACFEDALHTYFSVSDVRSIAIAGLEKDGYIDKLDGSRTKPATSHSIEFHGETDRVYVNSIADCVLTDAGWARTICVSKIGSKSTVVWNPWIDKSKRMADFGDDEWPSMVCIETANIGCNRIELQPGETHATTAIVSVTAL